MLVDDLKPLDLVSGLPGGTNSNGVVFTHEFVATADSATVVLDGANVDPVLSPFPKPFAMGLTVEDLGAPPIFEGDTVFFDGSLSFDPGGTPITYLWEVFGADGLVTSGTDADFSFIAPDDGTLTANLTVTDGGGAMSIDSATILVNDVEPLPDAGLDATFVEGDTVNFTGVDDVGPSDTAFNTWVSIADNGQVETGTGLDGQGFAFVPNDNGTYTVHHSVVDEETLEGLDFSGTDLVTVPGSVVTGQNDLTVTFWINSSAAVSFDETNGRIDVFVDGISLGVHNRALNPVDAPANNETLIGRQYEGMLDSVRFYSIAFDDVAVRNDLAVASVTGAEANLIAAYNFNEPTGNTLLDASPSVLHGFLGDSSATFGEPARLTAAATATITVLNAAPRTCPISASRRRTRASLP